MDHTDGGEGLRPRWFEGSSERLFKAEKMNHGLHGMQGWGLGFVPQVRGYAEQDLGRRGKGVSATEVGLGAGMPPPREGERGARRSEHGIFLDGLWAGMPPPRWDSLVVGSGCWRTLDPVFDDKED